MKNDFPIFKTHPDLVYLDSTATSQKPSYVIDGVAEYLGSSYANIHRGSYEISEISERLYEDSKKIVAKNIGADNWKEIIYTTNSTYALNVLSQSIWRTGLLKKGDTVLVSIAEHHANVVPWLILKEDYGIHVDFIELRDDYSLDLDDLKSKLNDSVKVVSLAHVSNTVGEIFALEEVGKILDEKYGPHKTPSPQPSSPGNHSLEQSSIHLDPLEEKEQVADDTHAALLSSQRRGDSEVRDIKRPLFIVDASQSVPHFAVDVKNLGCDAMFFTGHKVFADSGIGVLWAREDLLLNLKPIFSGGGAIGYVHTDDFTHSDKLPDKFEPGTPNLSGAVSLLKAFEYIDQIGGYEKLEEIEHELVVYTVEKFEKLQQDTSILNPFSCQEKGATNETSSPLVGDQDELSFAQERDSLGRNGERCCEQKKQLHLIGGMNPKTRVGVFTFYIDGIHSFDISDYLAENNICIRAGQHCAEPFMKHENVAHTCRMSLHIYNTRKDIDTFFDVLKNAIEDLA